MESYFALVKEFGGPLALAIVILYGAWKAGAFRWLYRAHRAVSHQAIDERSQLSQDEKDYRSELRADNATLRSDIAASRGEINELRDQVNAERTTCDRRIAALEERHDACEERLAAMDEAMRERDRVRRKLALEIVGMREEMRAANLPVSGSNRLAELILGEDIEAEAGEAVEAAAVTDQGAGP